RCSSIVFTFLPLEAHCLATHGGKARAMRPDHAVLTRVTVSGRRREVRMSTALPGCLALTGAHGAPQTAGHRSWAARGSVQMGQAARVAALIAPLLPFFVPGPEPQAIAIEKDRLVPAGGLVIAGRRLACGNTQTLLRDFEGFAVSSTVIMLNMQALKDLPQQ